MLRLWSRSRKVACLLQQRGGHTASVLDGKKISKQWQSDLQAKAADVADRLGRSPALGVVLVGNRPDSKIYVRRKQEAGLEVGIKVLFHHLPEFVQQESLEQIVKILNDNSTIDGVLVQLPLPKHLDEEAIVNAIDPKKDVDGFHPHHRQMLKERQQPHFLPCTALGVMELITRSGVSLKGKTAVVIGDSGTVGTPMAMLLQANGVAALTVCPRSSYPEAFADSMESNHEPGQARADSGACLPPIPKPAAQADPAESISDVSEQPPALGDKAEQPISQMYKSAEKQTTTSLDVGDPPTTYSAPVQDLPRIARTADILVVAVGHANLVKQSWVKPGAVVIDVGINVEGDVDTGKYHVVGDVAYDEAAEVASAITPVPGGVGPMTIAAVLQNTIDAANLYCHELDAYLNSGHADA